MNNWKKAGLTALAGSLVATSAYAGAVTVSGTANLTYAAKSGAEDSSGTSYASGTGVGVDGDRWGINKTLSFSGSGEMDNGWTVSTSIEMDNHTAANSDRSIAIDTGMGKLTFSGEGGSGPIGAWDDVTPTANEEAHGVAVAGTQTGATSDSEDSNFFIFDYTAMDNVAIKASYNPSATTTRIESSHEIGILYTGVEGLSIYAATGENNDAGSGSTKDLTNLAVKYTAGSFTIGLQDNEVDSAAANADQEFSAMGLSYAVSDDLSVSINSSTVDYQQTTLDDQEATGVSISYTQGGMTVSASHSNIDNVAGSSTADNSGYEVNFAFAF